MTQMTQPSTIYKPGKLSYLWNYLSSTLDNFKAKLLGYRTYKAFLTQTGTDAPVATIVENTLGLNLTFEYDSIGVYYAFTDAPLFNNSTSTADGRKIEVTITPNYTISPGNTDTQLAAYPVFFNVVGITTLQTLSNSDEILGAFCSTVLEIKVYN